MPMVNFYKAKKGNRGVAMLVTVILFGALISLLSGTMAILSYWENNAVKSKERSVMAYYAAYSGLLDSLLKLERNKDYSATNSTLSCQSATSTINVSTVSGTSTIDIVANAQNIERKLQGTVQVDATTGLITIYSLNELSL
jgi:hypothetical protein